MNGFTRAVVLDMLRDRQGTAETVLEWMEAEPDLEKRARGFARSLEVDLASAWRIYIVADRKHLDLVYLAVARYLLKKFAPRPWALATPSAN
jgi:hypothetical protein